MSKRDYYEILGVSRTATDQEIKSAYRKLALKFHPDRNPGDKSAEDNFKEAAEAYAVLVDTDKRHMYDRFGHAGLGGAATGGFDPNAFSGFEDILGGLGDIFGFGDAFGGGRRRGGPQRGADLRYDLEISFDEAAKGTEAALQIPRQEKCETCKGNGAAPGTSPTTCPQCRGSGQLRYQQGFFTVARTCSQCRGTGKVIAKPCQTCHGGGTVEQTRKLTVKIPAGIATGQRLRLSGEGEAGTLGGPPGDLYVVIFVQEHKFFQRDGNNLHCAVPLPFTTLALGAEIKVPGLDGDETVKIPEGTQPGATFRLRGKGMPDVSGRGHGDLLVTIQGVTPKRLTKEQKKLLEQLAETMPETKIKPASREDEDDDREQQIEMLAADVERRVEHYPNMSLTRSNRLRSSCSALSPRARGSNFSFGSASASCSSSWRCCLVSFFGVCTWTVANRSPRPRPFTSGMPLPRRRNVAPVVVPSGTFTDSGWSSVGTRMSPPSASVVKFTPISQNRLLPSRRKNS